MKSPLKYDNVTAPFIIYLIMLVIGGSKRVSIGS